MSRTAWITVVIVAMAVLFPICFAREHSGYKSMSARAVTTAPRNPDQQRVVWSELEKKDGYPAHYINGGNGPYYTACGEELPAITSHTEMIDHARAEKRTPCAKCKAALQAFGYMDYLYKGSTGSSGAYGRYDQRLRQNKK